MTKREIMDEWGKESACANKVIDEILREFLDFILFCMIPHPKQPYLDRLCEIHQKSRDLYNKWRPVYEASLEAEKKDPL